MNNEVRKNRTTSATITIFSADNTPLANQEVTIAQTNHKFLFGTAVFDLVPLTNGEYAGEEKERAEQRFRNGKRSIYLQHVKSHYVRIIIQSIWIIFQMFRQ